jgi:uncharacterized protein with gpF-like domain
VTPSRRKHHATRQVAGIRVSQSKGAREFRAAKGDIILDPVHANAGISAWYRARLEKLIDEMHRSVMYFVQQAYAAQEPVIAQDEQPAEALWKAMRKLRVRWQRNFNVAAPKLAKHFTQKVEKRSQVKLEGILREAGFSVQFKMTKAQANGIKANIHENVSLIRSIPQKHFNDIEGLVMRSVQAGRDLAPLSDALRKTYGKTKKRAALIARDQNNKATAFLTRTRQAELGITEAVWLHSTAGKRPRPTHLANDGERYDIKTGWYDPDAHGAGKGDYIFPGELINCRCVSRSVIPGFNP